MLINYVIVDQVIYRYTKSIQQQQSWATIVVVEYFLYSAILCRLAALMCDSEWGSIF